MGVKITIDIKLNSQSIANNTSNVTVNVNASWSGGSWNHMAAKGWLKIEGTAYDFAEPFNTNNTNSGVETLFSKTVTIAHNTDGTKKIDCSASYASGVSSGTVGASVPDYALPTIPRKSTLSVGNGTLGTAQTLTVTEQASGFTHTITAKCGSASTTICSKSTSNSISFTPPLTWASQNTTGTSVSVTYTITTYNGSTNVGSNTYTKTCAIPASVKPSCTISVSDATDIYNTHGVYVKTMSKFKIIITPTTSYGSAIASYKTTANGGTYTSASFTTGFLSSSGALTIKATVTDKRGRSGSASITVNVHDYSPPVVSKLTVHRCNEDGSSNDEGEYVKVVFDASVTDVNNQETSTTYLEYKKTTESKYTKLVLFEDYMSVTDYTHIFQADSGSSYDVRVSIEDVLDNITSRSTVVSTAFTLMHWSAGGRGIGVGKLAEQEDVFDIGLKTRFMGGILYTVLQPGYNLGNALTPGFYVGHNTSSNNYEDCPITSGTFTLEVKSAGPNGQLWQILTLCDKTKPLVYERFYYTNAWGNWTEVCHRVGEWQYPTLSSEFVMYGTSETDNKPRYRKDGRVVEVRGIVTPAQDIPYVAGEWDDNHTIFTLPIGYRPSSPLYVLCQGSGACVWMLRVSTSGTVDFTRYRNGDAGADANNGCWLPFHVTFLV